MLFFSMYRASECRKKIETDMANLLDLEIGTVPLCLISIFSCVIIAYCILSKKSFAKQTPAVKEECVKMRIDPGKRLAQNVKFLMRMKRKMRAFKERKLKESEINASD